MTIWMSGSETRGMIWSMSEDAKHGDEQEQTEGQRFHKCISFWVSAMGE